MATNYSNSPSYTVPEYGSFDWVKENYPLLKKYKQLREGIKNNNYILSQNQFVQFYPFLNTENKALGLPKDPLDNIDYSKSNNIEEFKTKEVSPALEAQKRLLLRWFHENLNNGQQMQDTYKKIKDEGVNWLNPLGKEFYKWYTTDDGEKKIRAYEDYLNLSSLPTEEKPYSTYIGAGTNSNLNTQDRFKLSKAYNEAVQDAVRTGNTSLANRLSLYMTNEGIKHYGYGNHFDLNHQKKRWDRKLSNGQTVGDFLDWIYEQRDNIDNRTLYNIIRNATKYNFDITPDFWKKLGENGRNLMYNYAESLGKRTLKQGGQIFNMLFV